MVSCKLPPKSAQGYSSLPDIYAIDAYIFWSLLFSPLSHARLPFYLNILAFAISHSLLVASVIFQLCDLHIHIQTIPRCRFCSSVVWITSRTSSLSLSDPFETFFCRVTSTSTKSALCLNSICSLTISTSTWAPVNI